MSHSYIAYLDLLGTRGFCEDEELYYKNIKNFTTAVETVAPILKGCGRIGIFSDCVYVECAQLEKIMYFLIHLRSILIGDELFFNAAISKGEIGVESISMNMDNDSSSNESSEDSNIFGVRFTNKEIASIYCKQTNFRGVGIWIDPELINEFSQKTSFNLIESFYYAKEEKNKQTIYIPHKYYDVPLFSSFDNEQSYSNIRKQNILYIVFKVLYSSHCKSQKYSAYYISLLINIIRSCSSTNIKWNRKNQTFENTNIEFDVMYNFICESNKYLNNLIGLDCICLTFLDMIYNSKILNDYEKAEITNLFVNKFSCLNEYKYSLDMVPSEPFTNDNRKSFINYCNNDMTTRFVERIIENKNVQ